MLTAEKILNSLNNFNGNRRIEIRIASDEEPFIKSYVKLVKIEHKLNNMNSNARQIFYNYEIDATNEFMSKIKFYTI